MGNNDWRPAKALTTLIDQVDAAHPGRPEGSDGTVGDARHQAEGSSSQHNPIQDPQDPNGLWVVRAHDFTTAPWSHAFADELRLLGSAGDKRVRYVIFDRLITSAEHGWAWSPYSGTDPHTGHVHLSLVDDPDQYDRTDAWPLQTAGYTAQAHTPPAPIQTPTEGDDDMLRPDERQAVIEADKVSKANGMLLGQLLAATKQLSANVAALTAELRAKP